MDSELLLKFKETQNSVLLEEILKDDELKRYINVYVRKKLNDSPSSLYSFEDLVNITYTKVWEAINKYKFICPECGERFVRETKFISHCIKTHGKLFDPKVSIKKYVFYVVGVYIKNTIRDEYSSNRKTNWSLNQVPVFSMFEESETEDSGKNVESYFLGFENCSSIHENDILFNIIVDTIIKGWPTLAKFIFECYIQQGMKQTDIAEILFRGGRYCSKQSASVIVSKTLKEIKYALSDKANLFK